MLKSEKNMFGFDIPTDVDFISVINKEQFEKSGLDENKVYTFRYKPDKFVKKDDQFMLDVKAMLNMDGIENAKD